MTKERKKILETDINLTDYIENQLENYAQGIYPSFAKTCENIALHSNIELLECTDKEGIFEVSILSNFTTRLIIKNTYKYPKSVDAEHILLKVSEVSGLKLDALKSKRRIRKLVEARHAYMILSKQLTDSSFTDIARLINRDHATAHYAQNQQHVAEIKSIINRTKLVL